MYVVLETSLQLNVSTENFFLNKKLKMFEMYTMLSLKYWLGTIKLLQRMPNEIKSYKTCIELFLQGLCGSTKWTM